MYDVCIIVMCMCVFMCPCASACAHDYIIIFSFGHLKYSAPRRTFPTFVFVVFFTTYHLPIFTVKLALVSANPWSLNIHQTLTNVIHARVAIATRGYRKRVELFRSVDSTHLSDNKCSIINVGRYSNRNHNDDDNERSLVRSRVCNNNIGWVNRLY